ncbi:ChaN family lipoprotein [Azospirillum thermophilum]|uniref:ChaN family lipoprotein n=1 Tax=Azospirillum thermophilum TaxID=2202148 RepID=UPI001FEC11F2|nr:ChaN family lipoprotein [Azospirillum thermophilum]
MLSRLFAALICAGCAVTGPAALAAAATASPAPSATATPAAAPAGSPARSGSACVPPGVWADGAGKPAEPVPTLRRIAEAPAVLLGERHDQAEHHRWQLHTLAALHALNPDIAVGLEMLPRRVQPVLDRWSAGELTEAEFLKASEWRTLWGFDPQLYLPILHFARMNRLPVVALNVERKLISRTARDGWAAIPKAEREGVGDPAPATDEYRDRLDKAMAAHGPGERPAAQGLQRFVEAQTVWDRAMAERIADTRRDTGRMVVAILGQGHVEWRGGVPHQLQALGMADPVVLLPWDGERDCADLDGRIADAVFGLAPPEEAAEPPKPRLGVMLEPAGDGVRIASVSDRSVAAAAGLTAGDLVTEAAGKAVRSVSDLTSAVQRQAPGTWLPLTVRRGGDRVELLAKFPAE